MPRAEMTAFQRNAEPERAGPRGTAESRDADRTARPEKSFTLAIGGIPVVRTSAGWATHHSFGQIADLLAQRVNMVEYFGPQRVGGDESAADFPLTRSNIAVHSLGEFGSSMQALRHPVRLIGRYRALVHSGDTIFLRGSGPLVWTAHWFARWSNKRLVHWIVGNPVAVLRAEQRGYGRLVHWLGIAYARFEQRMTRLAARCCRSRILANGAELAGLFRGRFTMTVVSTSITEQDFRARDDTCQEARIRLLFVGFIRPEKGVEYLIRALPLVRADRPVELSIVGDAEQFDAERQRLIALADELGVADKITWEGYASFGDPLFAHMDAADIFVLPTLSEGTPRVLVEARARSLPVVSTNVGGIPSSVTDGETGLLVPPRDPAALATAINRIISDTALRQKLIRAGRERVREWTVERFADLVIKKLTDDDEQNPMKNAGETKP